MKRPFFIVLIGFFAAVLPVAAQEQPGQPQADKKISEYYYVNTTVEKIYPYRKGYIIQYRKGPMGIGRLYLPYEWFTEAGNKGEVVPIASSKEWPSLSIYYKNGEFSHVRLYVRRYSHQSWGNIPLNLNLDSYFENVSGVRLEY
ncbi:MAG: hypothetical protein LBU18_01865 [Treponema sp.]|jgi:hypothetical protein|nr:hypothetical protein [Treponema sp.]